MCIGRCAPDMVVGNPASRLVPCHVEHPLPFESNSFMHLHEAIPARPVRQISESASYYRDMLGFSPIHVEAGFAILKRDAVELHLWAANNETWRSRSGAARIQSGAESFLAGTASCRVGVTNVDALHAELAPRGVLHPNGALTLRPWGDRDFRGRGRGRQPDHFFRTGRIGRGAVRALFKISSLYNLFWAAIGSAAPHRRCSSRPSAPSSARRTADSFRFFPSRLLASAARSGWPSPARRSAIH